MNLNEILRIQEQKSNIITLLIFFISHKINRVEIPRAEAANAHCQKIGVKKFQVRRSQTVINKHPRWPSFLQIEEKNVCGSSN